MQHGKESSQIEYPQKAKYPGLQKYPRATKGGPIYGKWQPEVKVF
jgi:hypothetical protein